MNVRVSVIDATSTFRTLKKRNLPRVVGTSQKAPRTNDFLFVKLICNLISFILYLGSSISILESSVTSFPHVQHQQTTTVSRCSEVSGIWAPCICSLELCVGWYPCGLKYCKGKGDSNSLNSNQINSSYRCGIKTCRKCNNFSYYVRQKQQCLWDE